ncbi:MAG TPA: hypothetical protein VHK67_00605 [Rhabdochlamydiaceae bacterium]|jgi:hypothetical protein|nr:hypothetical protein [Rhabdochlamydiaceae bacterium]
MKFKSFIYGILGCAVLMSAVWKPGSAPVHFAHQLTLEDKKPQVTARVYSAEESEHILKADLTDKGYVPVEITIQNQGDHKYAISMASTAQRSEKPKDVAWKFYKASVARGVGWRIVSFFCWPLSIPSTIDSIVSYKNKKALLKSLTAKGFKEIDEVVLPYSVVKRLLYIPQEAFYQTFSVSMEDLDGDELVVVPVTVS